MIRIAHGCWSNARVGKRSSSGGLSSLRGSRMVAGIATKRFLLTVGFGFALVLGDHASAQDFCATWPPCPEDGATPIQIFSGGFRNCTCPNPASCPFPNNYSCALPGGPGKGSWSCDCLSPDPINAPNCSAEPFAPGCPPPPLPTPNQCGPLLCPDGSTPTSDGFHCFCPK